MHTPSLRFAVPSALARSRGGVVAFVALAAAGCQSFAPGAISGLASREEKAIVKLAEHDPFPSPSDVGLKQPTSVP